MSRRSLPWEAVIQRRYSLARLGGIGERLEQSVEAGGSARDLRLEAFDGRREARHREGLHHVVDRALLEGGDGILVVGGDEGDVAPAARLLRDLEPGQAGHLDVEEQDVRRMLGRAPAAPRCRPRPRRRSTSSGQSLASVSRNSPRRIGSSSAITAFNGFIGPPPAQVPAAQRRRRSRSPGECCRSKRAAWLGRRSGTRRTGPLGRPLLRDLRRPPLPPHGWRLMRLPVCRRPETRFKLTEPIVPAASRMPSM